MKEMIKSDQIERVLQMYAKLSDGYVVNKAEEAVRYGVNEKSIQRDIEHIRNFLDNDSVKKWDKYVGGIPADEKAVYILDGIHPTKAGYRDWWGPGLERQLLAHLAEH